MKKLITTIIVFAFLANVSAQIEINSSGQVGIGTSSPLYKLHVMGDTYVAGNILLGNTFNFLGTTSDIPIAFKVNNVYAGFTGYASSANVSFGYGALNSLSGANNTAIGYRALYSNTTGVYNIATGADALTNNTTGWRNIAVGAGALYSNETGEENIATGTNALYLNKTGGVNIAIGTNALYSNTKGRVNIAIGNIALYSNTEGNENIAIGTNALGSNTTGGRNTAIGIHALANNNKTESEYNTATGYSALVSNTIGHHNTATGAGALNYNTTGSYNTAIGVGTFFWNTTGSFNTAIGFETGVSAGELTNATAIGYGALVTASNQVRIGNGSVTSIGGYANWSNFSDGRAKKNIKADVPGLNFINLLQPVTYNLDLDAMDNLLGIDKAKKNKDEKDMPKELKDKNEKAKKTKEEQVETGFVAQDVEKVAKKIGYNFSGVNVDESGIYSLSYAEFVVPLVKAVQELSTKNDQLQKQVDELTGLVNKLLEKQTK